MSNAKGSRVVNRRGARGEVPLEVIAEAALAYLEPLAEGRPVARWEVIRRLVAEHTGLDFPDKTLRKIVYDAFELNLVEVVLKYRPFERIKDLEEALKKEFDVPEILVLPSQASKKETYELLGSACANGLAKSRLMIQSETIGLGSGRACAAFVDGLKQLSKGQLAHFQKTHFVSMSGSLYPLKKEPFSDADKNVTIAADLLKDYESSDALANFGLVQEDLGRIWKHSSVNPQRDLRLNKAVLGIGILEKPHRIYEAINLIRESDDDSGVLNEQQIPKSLYLDLKELCNLCDEYDRETDSPLVADSCNRLFLLDDGYAFKKMRNGRTLQELIDHINQHLLTMTWAQLNRIENVCIIIAGNKKARALQKILSGGTEYQPNVLMLCLDEEAAKYLLGKPNSTRDMMDNFEVSDVGV